MEHSIASKRIFKRVLLALLVAASCPAAFATEPQMLSASEARKKVDAGALLVDVRTPEEFASGHVEGALNIPQDQISERSAEFGNDKSREIVLYCRSGRRSETAKRKLQELGFGKVFNAGGLSDWTKFREGAGRPSSHGG